MPKSEEFDEIAFAFLNFDIVCTSEVRERISSFIPHFMMYVIAYPGWSYSMLVKGGTGVSLIKNESVWVGQEGT